MRSLMALALVLAGSAAGPACGHTAVNPGPTAGDLSSSQTRVPGQYLVTLAPDADVKVITDLYGRFGIKDVQGLGSNVFLMILTEDPGPATMEEIRGRDARIKAVQPNFIYRMNRPANAQ